MGLHILQQQPPRLQPKNIDRVNTQPVSLLLCGPQQDSWPLLFTGSYCDKEVAVECNCAFSVKSLRDVLQSRKNLEFELWLGHLLASRGSQFPPL